MSGGAAHLVRFLTDYYISVISNVCRANIKIIYLLFIYLSLPSSLTIEYKHFIYIVFSFVINQNNRNIIFHARVTPEGSNEAKHI